MGVWVKGKIVAKKQWNERLYSLSFEAETKPLKAGQFVRVGLDIDGERVGRPYSCVNAPDERPLEIYFNIVPEGPLSPRLATMQVGDDLWVWDSMNGLLTVEDVPQRENLWMFATGTALGPFLAILKSEKSYSHFKKLVLVHAVRTQDELTYSDTVRAILAAHGSQVVFVPIVSREIVADALQGRIPAMIDNGLLEVRVGVPLKPENSHVMLCGNSGMIQDTNKVLEKRGMKKHTRREPGHISTEKYH